MKKLLYVTMACLVFGMVAVPAHAQEEIMTNEQVISLTKAGLAAPVVIGKIRTSKSKFDLSTDALIKLKKTGVSDDIVAAMLEAKSGGAPVGAMTAAAPAGDPNDPATKHGYGIYLYEEKNGQRKMTQLQPNVSAQNRTGGAVTAAFTPFGLGKMKTKANLPGNKAALQIATTSPIFYFYLDTSTGGLNT
ncbi:MAG: hypothetical protein LC730_02600, partial [Acidobacteria bacterium]|nr:hypothetical protein [Acidobacteriota bacterium]